MQACRQSSEGLGLSDTAVFMLNNTVEMQVQRVSLLRMLLCCVVSE